MSTQGTAGAPAVGEDEQPHRPLPTFYTLALLGAVALLAVAARTRLFDIQTDDYKLFLAPWWEYIRGHGGFHALKDNFANYNMPYLYLMAGLSYVAPHHPLLALKVLSVVFDFGLAAGAYLLVAYRRPGYLRPAVAALTILLLPTVILNGSLWAQSDAIYTTFLLLALFFLVRRQPWLACTLFGVAYAFKQQALFVLPILLVVALRKDLPWRTLLAAPVAFLVLDIPALIIGRPLSELLGIYSEQAGRYQQLTSFAPSIYQLFPVPGKATADGIRGAGLFFAAAVVLVIVTAVANSRQHLTTDRLLMVATLFAIAVPFVLPSMHDRYFFAGDVLSVIVAFRSPRKLWFVPLLIQFASATMYEPFLFRAVTVPMVISALAMFAAILVLLHRLARELYPATVPAPAATTAVAQSTVAAADTVIRPRPHTAQERSELTT